MGNSLIKNECGVKVLFCKKMPNAEFLYTEI